MIKIVDTIRQNIIKRSPKEQLYIFGIGFVIIYLLWLTLLYFPLSHAKQSSTDELDGVNLQIEAQKAQMTATITLVKSSVFLKKLAEDKAITNDIKVLQDKISKLSLNLVNPDDIPKIAESVVGQQGDTITLQDVTTSPAAIWLPTGIDKSDLASLTNTDIYIYNIQIVFHSDFFSTLDYLRKLEKLSWHIYWDSLNYKVDAYPKATVTVKFHVLSDQKG